MCAFLHVNFDFFLFFYFEFQNLQFSSCHFGSFTFGGNNIGGINLKFGGYYFFFDGVQGSSTLFLKVLRVFQNNLVHLNLLSHLFLPMAIF